jgi:hypothetical protein
MRRSFLAFFGSIALVLAAVPTTADAVSASGWKIYAYNSGGSLNSKQATGDATSVARFEFLPTPDDALLAIKQPDGAHTTLNGKTITATFAIEGVATFQYYGQPDACGAPANTRLYFNTNGPFAYTNFWWSNPASAVLTAPGTAVVTANVNPAMWSDWNGQFGTVDAETTAAFEAAAADPDLVGLSFGGGCFFENGVGTSSGSATFKLISYTIE